MCLGVRGCVGPQDASWLLRLQWSRHAAEPCATVAVCLCVCFGERLCCAWPQVWNGLALEKALHLLPPLRRCFGPPAQYLPPPTAASAAATASPDPAFLAAVQRSLVEGDLDKALQPLLPPPASTASTATATAAAASAAAAAATAAAAACSSVSAEVGLHTLATWLLDRSRWPAVERALKTAGAAATLGAAPASDAAAAAGADVADSDKQEGAGARPLVAGAGAGAPAAAAMLGGLVRCAAPEAVAQLVLFAEARCGLARGDSAAVLAQTCAGDTGLRERVRQVLALCGLA